VRIEHESYARSDRIVVRYAHAIVRWRWVVLGLTLVITGLAAAGAAKLQVRGDYRYNFGPGNPQLIAFEAVERTYGKNDSVLFVLSPEVGDVYTRDVLQAVLWLTEQAWQIPYSTRVDSLTNFQHIWAEADDLIVEDLVEDAAVLTDADLGRIRAIARAEPQILGKVVASDDGATAVAVTLQIPELVSEAEIEVTNFSRNLINELRERHPNVRVALSGLAVMSASFEENSRRDLATLVPLMYAVLIATMLLFLRSFWGTLATTGVAGFSAAGAMGIGGWLGIPLTMGSAMAPTVILTIAIADGVHILVTFARDLRAGQEKVEALVDALRVNTQPVFLTSLTTVIGFLSMNFSDNPMFRDLGNLTALGVTAAWVYSMTFLPALVAVCPYRVRPAREVGGLSMERFGEWLIAYRDRVLAGMILLLLGTAALIPRIELNDTFTSMFDRSLAFRRDADFISERLPGLYQFQYSLSAGEADGINDPGYWETLDEFATWLRAQPDVTHVNTLSDTMKRLNRSMHGDDPVAYRLPSHRELAAQYLLLYEMSLPYGLDLNNQINVERSATKVTLSIDNLSARELREVDRRAMTWLRERAPSHMETGGASPGLMFANMSQRNIEGMVRGTGVAFVLISLVLAGALRSVTIGVLSLIPNLAPTVIALGVWAVLVGRVGMSVSVVAACSLGIIVDASVHFLSKYLRARRERGASSSDAVRYALSTVGAALWVTFLILILGFNVLALSHVEMNKHFGLLIAITIGAALLTSFLLLPTLLMRVEGDPQKQVERRFDYAAS